MGSIPEVAVGKGLSASFASKERVKATSAAQKGVREGESGGSFAEVEGGRWT